MKKTILVLSILIFSCESNVNQVNKTTNITETPKTTYYYQNNNTENKVITNNVKKDLNVEDELEYTGIDKEFRSDFKVSSSSQTQGSPSISINNKGEFIVAWVRIKETKDFIDIYARKFFADGTKTEEFKVNSESLQIPDMDRLYSRADTEKSKPKVSIDEDGNFSISWQNNKKLYLRTFDKEANPKFTQKELDTLEYDTSGFETYMSNGVSYIAYDYSSNGFKGFTLKRFDINGNLIKGVYINNYWSQKSKIALTNSGEINVFTNNNLYKISSDGEQSLISELKINNSYQDIGINGNNSYLIAEYENKDFFITNKKGIRTKANTSKFETYFSAKANITLNTNEDYVLTWGSNSSNSKENNAIFAKVQNATSKSSSTIQISSNNTLGFNANQNVSLSNNGVFATTWENWHDNKEEYNIFVRKLDINNFKTKNVVQVDTTIYSCLPSSKSNINSNTNIAEFQTDYGKETFNKSKDLIEKIKNKPTYTGPIEIIVNNVDNKQIGNTNISSAKINDKSEANYQTGSLIINFSKSVCRDKIFEKYKTIKQEKNGAFELITFDLKKVETSKIENIIRDLNKNNLENITKIEFSNEDSLKTFIIFSDLITNYSYAIKNVEMNLLARGY